MAHIVGTNGNDSLVGTSGVDTIEGLGGNDTLVGLGGSDSLIGGLGNDRYVVGTGDVLSDAGGIDTIETSITWHLAAGFENLVATGTATTSHGGNNLANHITGNAGSNWIAGREGNDTLLGGGGNDTFNMSNGAGASYGSDSIDGGTGVDTLDFGAAARTAVFVDLEAGTASGGGTGGAGSAVLVSIENVNGSAFNDSIIGNAAANFLFGFDGNDGLIGGEGNDRLEGGAGDDHLRGQYGADTLVGGDGNDALNGDQVGFDLGDSSADQLIGGAGNDTLDGGFGGGNMLDGGLGDDTYYVWATNDVLSDVGGIDHVITVHSNWTLGDGFENLSTTTDDQGSSAASFLAGNELNNIVDGNKMNVGRIEGRGGNDTLYGSGLDGHTEIDGGDGNDVIHGGHSATMWGGAGNDFLESSFRPDILDGGVGNDTLQGGDGDDQYVFSVSPGLANADSIIGFESATDTIVLDGAAHANAGASGRFAAGDARFVAGAGFTSGQDGTDRVVYNTTTGQLFYDADGSGAGASQLIATFQGAPGLAAMDIAVINGSSGGSVINGTSGNDSLVGTPGDDTINGFAGNDTLAGSEGADSLVGGDGDDVLDAGQNSFDGDLAPDTVDGGLGDDVYYVSGDGDVILSDPGGIDTVHARNTGWTLGEGLDNLIIDDMIGTAGPAIGNELNNYISGFSEGGTIRGMGGDDHLVLVNVQNFSDAHGGEGNDTIHAGRNSDLFGDAGNDVLFANSILANMTGGTGNDDFVFTQAGSGAEIRDFASSVDKIRLDANTMTQLGASGNFNAGDVRFHAAAGATGGHDADDRVVYNTSTNQLFYDADGSGASDAIVIATLQPGATLVATDIAVDNGSGGSNTITGTEGDDLTWGTQANDTVNLLGGDDGFHVFGAFGGEASYGNDTVNGGSGFDAVYFFDDNNQSGIVADLAAGLITGGGPGGSGSIQVNSVEFVEGTTLSDHLIGNSEANGFAGGIGADTLEGGAGNDTLDGYISGAGDTYVFAHYGAAHWDFADIQSNDIAVLDGAAFTAIGVSGAFATNDARFFSGAGANAGQDGDDRIIYDTDTGDLWYDADGNGSGAAQLVANTFGPTSTVNAAQFHVINGSASGSTINGTTGNDSLTGGGGNDTINGLAGADLLQGLGGNDSIVGGTGWDTLQGGDGGDWLHAGGWSDTMTGGAGADSFVWTEAGTGNRDTVTDFASGTDELVFENGTLTAMGAAGAWGAGDARFWAAAGATAGHDADDRLIYNTSNGNLYYDADGSGAGAAQVVATFTGAPGVVATDITVI